jgi:hypothetical protein
MKIRQGFVSNSSSSSFCLFYREAELSEIDDEDVAIFVTDNHCDSASALFFPEPADGIVDWLKANGLPGELRLLHTYQLIEDGDDVSLPVEKISQGLPTEGNVRIMCGERAEDIPENLTDFLMMIGREE